jgi:hypothetical protein
MPTPKHLMAMAVSKMTDALGYVIWLSAKKLAEPRSRYLAQRVCRYKPKPEARPDQQITNTPRVMPMFDMAWGIAKTPAPTMVLTRFITEDIHDALPATPFSFLCDRRREGSVEAGLEGACSLGTESMAA